jgi:DNA-directed RNA polymerase specialized sigma24 family protein
MSKRIATLLGQPERVISKTLTALEGKNGYPSHDARHLAETVQQARRKLVDLGLDPDDTTAEELYQSLLAKFERDSQSFDVENNFHSLDFVAKVDKAVDILKRDGPLPQRWVLKSTAAKELLRKQPPKRLMKEMSYRSIGSMLKRESIAALFILANTLESSTWRKELLHNISKSDSTDFELRHVSIIGLSGNGNSPLVYNDDIGALAACQTESTANTHLLGLTVLLSEFLSSLGDQTMSFSSEAVNWWRNMDGLVAELDGQPISFNIKDIALNHANRHKFTDRLLSAGRAHYWKNLLNRYENQLVIEEDRLADFAGFMVMPKAPIRQPAFEYVEEF